MKSWKSVILTVSPSSKMRLNHSEVHIKVEIAGHLGSSAFFLLTATKLLQLLVVAHSYQMIQKPSRKRHSSRASVSFDMSAPPPEVNNFVAVKRKNAEL